MLSLIIVQCTGQLQWDETTDGLESFFMRHQESWIALIVLLGLAIRAGWGLVHSSDFTTDSDGYIAHAQSVAAGNGFLGPFSQKPTAFRPPAYPMILGALIRYGQSDAASVAIVNFSASVLIMFFTWQLCQQLCLPFAATLTAIFLVGFDPLLVRYSSLPMSEVPCAAVLLAAVVFFRAGRPNRDRPNVMGQAISSGVLFGLGSLVRPVVLVTCGLLSLWALARSIRTASTESNDTVALKPQRNLSAVAPRPVRSVFLLRAAVIMRVLLPAVVAAISISPWIVRNAIQFHRFIPATTHGGYTLALGNNPDFYRDVINGTDRFPWDGQALDAWQQRMITESQKDGIRIDDEPGNDAWYYRRAIDAIRDDPRSFLKASILRLRRFWAVSTADGQMPGSVFLFVSIWYVLLWAGLILAIVAGGLRRKIEQSVGSADLWLVVLSFMLMHSVYWTDTRMRAPLMPILCVLSVSGWTAAAGWISRWKSRFQDPSLSRQRSSTDSQTLS